MKDQEVKSIKVKSAEASSVVILRMKKESKGEGVKIVMRAMELPLKIL